MSNHVNVATESFKKRIRFLEYSWNHEHVESQSMLTLQET